MQGRTLAVKQLDLADGQLKKTVAIKGLREGERISLCGQYAIHTGSGKWRAMEAQHKQQTECAFPAMMPEHDTTHAAAATHVKSNRAIAATGKSSSPRKAAAPAMSASAASIQKGLAQGLSL